MKIKVIMHREDSKKITDEVYATIKDGEDIWNKIYEVVNTRNMISGMLGTGAVWYYKGYEVLEEEK